MNNEDTVIDNAAWSAIGFAEIAAKRWSDAGFTPARALEWRDNGISIHDASVLRSIPVEEAVEWLGDQYDPVDIVIYKQHGISLKEAAIWTQASFSASSAISWSGCGVSPKEAAWLRQQHVSPVQLSDWLSKGYPFDYAVEKCAAGLYVLSEEEKWARLGITEDEKAQYMEQGICDPEEAARFKARI
jgi:hypothetical protein